MSNNSYKLRVAFERKIVLVINRARFGDTKLHSLSKASIETWEKAVCGQDGYEKIAMHLKELSKTYGFSRDLSSPLEMPEIPETDLQRTLETLEKMISAKE